MKIINKLGLLSLIVINLACEKEIPLKTEEIEPRIVVNSLFTADDTIWVQLSESRNVLYQDVLPTITDATLQLTDANGTVLGDFTHTTNGYYYSTVIPAAGIRYGIKASKAGFNSISGFSSAPPFTEILTLDTVSSSANNTMEFTLKFSDDPAIRNYYSISITRYDAFEDELGELILYADPYFQTNEYYVVNGGEDFGDGYKYGTSFYFSDDLISGQTVKFKALSYYYEGINPNSFYTIELRSLSEDLYKYKVTYANYLDTQGSPFAQPVQVYSNIENGFGIFGGASIYRDTVLLQ